MSDDLLARVWPHAARLLGQIDAAIERDGAPGTHPLWQRMRAVGAMPAEAVEHWVWLDPQALLGARDLVRTEAEAMEGVVSRARTVSWHGAGATAFRTRFAHLAEYTEGADHRLADTAGFLAALATWIQHTRDEIAMEVAACLGSREAVQVTTELQAGTAAADLAERVLAVIESGIDSGWRLRDEWSDRLAEVTWREPPVDQVEAIHLEVW